MLLLYNLLTVAAEGKEKDLERYVTTGEVKVPPQVMRYLAERTATTPSDDSATDNPAKGRGKCHALV